MLTIAGNECQGRREENDEAHEDVNPCGMYVDRKGREKEREERHRNTVKYTGSGKGDSQTIPNFFHS